MRRGMYDLSAGGSGLLGAMVGRLVEAVLAVPVCVRERERECACVTRGAITCRKRSD